MASRRATEDSEHSSHRLPLNLPNVMLRPEAWNITEDEKAALKDMMNQRGWEVFRDRIANRLLEGHERSVLTQPTDVRFYQGAYWALCEIFQMMDQAVRMEAPKVPQINEDFWEG